MKLDYDCIRDLLIFLEDNLQYQSCSYGNSQLIAPITVTLSDVAEALPQHTVENIAYCSEKLIKANYLDGYLNEADQGLRDIVFYSISFEGHQYLESIRSQRIWDKVVSTFSEQAVPMSFSLIQGVAQGFITKMLGIS